MCAGGGDRLSTFIPVLLPPLPSLPSSFHPPLPNHSEISSDFFLLPTRLDCFSTLGFVKRFLVFQTGGGAFPPFIDIYFLNFLIFSTMLLGWGQCHHQAGLLPSILLPSSLHPLGCAHSVASVLLLFLFASQFPFGS